MPRILDGLADESEGVREAALSAGRTAVELFAKTSLPLLLPAVEAGIINDNWRIRQSSVELLGDLLFKVCSASALCEACGGNNTAMIMMNSLFVLDHFLVCMLVSKGAGVGIFRWLVLLARCTLTVTVTMRACLAKSTAAPSLKLWAGSVAMRQALRERPSLKIYVLLT